VLKTIGGFSPRGVFRHAVMDVIEVFELCDSSKTFHGGRSPCEVLSPNRRLHEEAHNSCRLLVFNSIHSILVALYIHRVPLVLMKILRDSIYKINVLKQQCSLFLPQMAHGPDIHQPTSSVCSFLLSAVAAPTCFNAGYILTLIDHPRRIHSSRRGK
jgi:hypothetical protein